MLKARFGVNAPTIMVGHDEIYAEGEGLEPDEVEEFSKNLDKPLVSV